MHGTLLLVEKPAKASACFQKVEAEAGSNLQLKLKLANAYFLLYKFKETENLEDFCKWMPNLWQLVFIMDSVLFEIWNMKSCHHFSKSYRFGLLPSTLSLLFGWVAAGNGKIQETANAYEVCLQIVPYMNYARLRLISIYEMHLPGSKSLN